MLARDLVLVRPNEPTLPHDFLPSNVEPIDAMGRREDESGEKISGAGELEAIRPPDGKICSASRLERPDVVPSQDLGAAASRQPKRTRGRSSPPGPPRPRATRSACLTSKKRSLRSFEAEPSTPRPTRAPASTNARTGATPAPSRRLEVGQWATPVPVSAKRRTSCSERWTQCAHQTSSASHPSSSRYSTGVQP